MEAKLEAQKLLSVDPTLTDIPTYGCIYCARNTGCYECRGHGVVGGGHGGDVEGILYACDKCLSACTACAFMRNFVLTLVRGRN